MNDSQETQMKNVVVECNFIKDKQEIREEDSANFPREVVQSAENSITEPDNTVGLTAEGTENGECDVSEVKEIVHPVVRAKSARELVKSQEHLLDLLQTMRYDLNKMDREAERIKEDIVRSNQLFHVMVKMTKPHHLPLARQGYNMSHSQTRVTYDRRRSRERVPNMRYLNQLSTYRPDFLSGSRRSSLSLVSVRDFSGSRSSFRYSDTSRGSDSRSGINISNHTGSSSPDSYSGTESDMESVSRQLSRYESSSNVSQDSTDRSLSGDSYESSTESTESSPNFKRGRAYSAGRRCSYIYTKRIDSPQQVQSDEIEL